MSTDSPAPPADARGRRPRPITADEFGRMIKASLLDDDRRVELWDGRLVERPTRGPAYFNTQTAILYALHPPLGEDWHVGVNCPLVLGPYDMPDASLVVVRGTPRSLPSDRHLTGAEVGLVIEILEPGPGDDLGPVTAAYAAGGAPPGSGSSTSTPGRSTPKPIRSSAPRRPPARSDATAPASGSRWCSTAGWSPGWISRSCCRSGHRVEPEVLGPSVSTMTRGIPPRASARRCGTRRPGFRKRAA
jgi:hypothetical protein